ncbi:hypothetical protein FOZ63_030231, partial [Perkinsus olseni]
MTKLIVSLNILLAVILLAANGQVMKLETTYEDSPPYGFGLFHTLTDGRGQPTTALVDTGPVSLGPTTSSLCGRIGMKRRLKGVVALWPPDASSARDGIRPSSNSGVCDQHTWSCPRSSGPDEGDPNFPSLVKQLRAKGAIGSSIFALYLFPSSLPFIDGALLLGGGDPSLHMNPMHFTELRTGDGYYMVKLGSLQV